MSAKPTLVQLILNAPTAAKDWLLASSASAQKTLLSLAKADVGLENVDNTSDADKPVSDAQQTALDAKQDTLVSGTNIKTVNSTSLLGPGDIALSGAASDILSDLTASEISITGAATATISRMHVCSGTSADYTVTLPAASGNAGKLIGFRMAAGLTKLVTLDGNASETIDGSTTRIMWECESAILLCDGSGWFKIAGKSRAMSGGICRTSAQTGIVTATATKCSCGVQLFDVGGITDIANGRLLALRPGTWTVAAALLYGNAAGAVPFGTAGDLVTYIYLNGAQYVATALYGVSTSNLGPAITSNIVVASGDAIEVWGYHSKGSNASFFANSGQQCQITALEEPQW